MAFTPEQRAEIDRLTQQALDLPVAERASFVREHSSEPAVLQEILSLLAALDQTGATDYLEAPAELPTVLADQEGTLQSDGQPASGIAGEQPGDILGPYTLIRKLGEGGFGTVWEASQRQPVQRQVALKIIKLGMDTHEVIARFEAERQALAMMEHPGIAHVYDAGATESGRPYFAMELVQGQPITAYCETHRLPLEQRLELFMLVCQGVQHAHQKGVIHRDLKPSNILVTEVDGAPVAKVIDFGISKATAQRQAEATMFTAHGQFIGTPAYMSPEQAQSGHADIDTRSDVYSLGVVLYELLTGAPPFDFETLRQAGWDEIRRVIREVEPMRPSTRLGSSISTPQAERNRSRFERAMRGDLDWIIMKALEKDRERRYATATSLGEDIQRFLRSEPVAAGPPSTLYRLKKLIRRNQWAFVALSTIAILLVAGVSGTLWNLTRSLQAERQARVEARKAEQIAQFLGEMLSGVGPSVARGRDTQLLREMLESASERVATELQDEPQVEAAVRLWIGSAFVELPDYDRAMHHLTRAEELYRQQPNPEEIGLVSCLSNMSLVYAARSEYEAAERAAREALTLQHTLADADAIIWRELDLANLLVQARRLTDEVEPLLLNALDYFRANGSAEDIAVALNSLGIFRAVQGEADAAETCYREALAMHRQALGDDHPFVLIDMQNLALHLKGMQRRDEAIELYEATLRQARPVFPDGHTCIASSLEGLAVLLAVDVNQWQRVVELRQEALEVRTKLFGARHNSVAEAHVRLGDAYGRLRQYAAADEQYRIALPIKKELVGEKHLDISVILQSLGRARIGQGDPAGAAAYYRETLELQAELVGVEHAEYGITLWHLATTQVQMGETRAAIETFQQSLRVLRKTRGDDDDTTINCRERLARALRHVGRADESAAVLAVALESRVRMGTHLTRNGLGTRWELAKTCAALGQTERAEQLFLETLAHPEVLGARASSIVQASYTDFLLDEQRYGDAETQLRDATAADAEPSPATIERFIRLYEGWHLEQPEAGHDSRAADWRERLPAPTTED